MNKVVPKSDRKNAIIIGASSGIGEALAYALTACGYHVGITGRRVKCLDDIKRRVAKDNIVTQEMDVTDPPKAQKQFSELVSIMNGVDLVIISAGVGDINPSLDYSIEERTIHTNVLGFTTIVLAAFTFFKTQGYGHLVGISSIAALRGSAEAPAYSASKAFMSNYLEGMRIYAQKNHLNVTVLDVQPGFVDTNMAKGEGLFWVASPKKAAKQIIDAIHSRKSHVYVTKRWRLIGWILKLLPDFLYQKL